MASNRLTHKVELGWGERSDTERHCHESAMKTGDTPQRAAQGPVMAFSMRVAAALISASSRA